MRKHHPSLSALVVLCGVLVFSAPGLPQGPITGHDEAPAAKVTALCDAALAAIEASPGWDLGLLFIGFLKLFSPPGLVVSIEPADSESNAVFHGPRKSALALNPAADSTRELSIKLKILCDLTTSGLSGSGATIGADNLRALSIVNHEGYHFSDDVRCGDTPYENDSRIPSGLNTFREQGGWKALVEGRVYVAQLKYIQANAPRVDTTNVDAVKRLKKEVDRISGIVDAADKSVTRLTGSLTSGTSLNFLNAIKLLTAAHALEAKKLKDAITSALGC